MKQFLIIATALLITACSTTTVPVTVKFPDNPGAVTMQACPVLQKLEPGAKLSDVSKTVSLNYETYYECAVKVDGWIEWYNIQKELFNKIN
jgi:hypothetical protein